MNIQEIRQKYPQYDSINDTELAERLRKKFYPDMAPDDFNRRIGLAPKPSTERTWTEAATDIGAGLVSGAGSLAQLPGQLYGLATGDMDNVSTRAGEAIKRQAEGMKSAGLKGREELRRQAIAAAEERGQVAAAATAFGQTIKDPGLLLNFVAEQLPNLLPGLAAAKGLSLATRGAASLGAKTAAAVGAGAVQQGADVGAGTYDRLVEELVAKGATEQEAAEGAINLARASGASAAVISVLANKYLPGGQALERVLAGGKTGLGAVTGAVTGALKEIPSEVTEEVGGQFGANIAMRQIKPEQQLTEGLGETAGMAAVGAVGLGGVTGAVGGRGAPQETAAEEDPRLAEWQRQQEQQTQEAPQELDLDAEYGALVQAREQLRQAEQTPEVKAQIKQITETLRKRDAELVAEQQAKQAQTQRGDELAAQSAFAAQEPQQMEFGGMGMPGTLPAAPEPTPTPAPTQKELEAAGQQRLPLRRTPAGQPTTSALEELEAFDTGTPPPTVDEDIPEPTLRKKPELIQHPEITEETVGKTTMNWVKTKKGQEFLRSIIDLDPAEAQARRKEFVGRRQLVRGDIFDAIYPEQAPTPAGVDVRPEPEAGQPAAEPSVGVPAPSGPDQTGAELAEPSDGAGVGNLSGPVGTEPVAQGAPAPAVAPQPLAIDQLLRGAPAAEPALEAEPEVETAPEPEPAPAPRRPSAFDIPKRSLFDPIREAQEARDEQGGVIYKGGAARVSEPPKLPTTPAAKKGTYLQRRAAFAKALGAVSGAGGNYLRGRANQKVAKAVADGNWVDLTKALAASKNQIVARVGELGAKLKGHSVRINEDAREVREVDAKIQSDAAYAAAAEVELLDKLRAMEGSPPEVLFEQLNSPNEAFLAFAQTADPSRKRPYSLLESAESLLGARTNMFSRRQAQDAYEVVRQAAEESVAAVGEAKMRTNASTAGRITVGVVGGSYNPQTRSVEIAGEYNAKDETTVAHEVAHAVLSDMVANPPPAKRPVVANLTKLYEHVKKVLDAQGKTPYGTSSVQEFVAEGLANPDFQFELSEIEYQGKTAWGKFTQFMANLLGLPSNNALAEFLAATETLSENLPSRTKGKGPTLFSLDNITRTSELLKAEPSFPQRAYQAAMQVVQDRQGLTPVDRFRVFVTDNMAATAKVLDSAWGGKVRSSLGQINPLVALRQAQDAAKMYESLFELGGVKYDPASGTFGAVKTPYAVVDIFRKMQTYADARGITLQEASADISKMGEARRSDELIRSGSTAKIAPLSNADPRPAKDQIDEKLRQLNADPQAKAILDMMQKSREHFVDFMADTGRITTKQAAEWKQYAEYVPFDRIGEFDESFRATTSPQGLGRFANRRALVGSATREVGNIFENHMKLVTWMAAEGMKARAVRDALEAMQVLGAGRKLGKKVPGNVKTSQVVYTYENGQKVFYEVNDPLYAVAFQGVGAPISGFFKALHKVSNFLRSTITLFPPFVLKQVVLDTQRAFVSAGVNNPYALPGQILKNFFQFAWADITGKRLPKVQELGAMGIAGGYDLDLSNPAESLTYEYGLRKRGPIQKVLRWADGLLRASDLATRAAVYDQTRKEGGDKTLAEQRAREIINFRRKGASRSVGFLIQTVPFVNAYIQSMDLLYRNAMGTDNSMGIGRNAARNRLLAQLGTVTAFSMLYALTMAGDDEYENADLRTKFNNWIIPGVGMIPVPPEWAAITKVPAEMFMESLRNHGTPKERETAEIIGAVLSNMQETLSYGVPIPAAIKPLAENFTNYSFFTKRHLEGTYQQTLDETVRTNANTSEMAKAFAEAVEKTTTGRLTFSPIDVDNFFRGYFGSTGGALLTVTDAILNPDRLDRPAHQLPLVGMFIPDNVGTRAEREYYEFANKVLPRLRTVQSLETRAPSEAEAYVERFRPEIEAAQAVEDIRQTLTPMLQYERYLRSDEAAKSGMSQEERKAEIEELRQVRSEYLQEVMNDIKAAYRASKSARP
jgi:hypothetical protein